MEVGEGKVWLRQLMARADEPERLERVLLHELTHVVLADRFSSKRIPRWADEGIAVLSEPAARRQTQRVWLRDEVASRRHWSLQAVLTVRDYPQDARQADLFYAQSAAWIEFLVSKRQHTERDVVRFIEATQRQPLAEAVRESFPDESLETLETAWVNWLRAPKPE